MKYKVNLKKTEEGYSVWVPGLPGCWSQGKTEEEALENIKDAIKAYLDSSLPLLYPVKKLAARAGFLCRQVKNFWIFETVLF